MKLVTCFPSDPRLLAGSVQDVMCYLTCLDRSQSARPPPDARSGYTCRFHERCRKSDPNREMSCPLFLSATCPVQAHQVPTPCAREDPAYLAEVVFLSGAGFTPHAPKPDTSLLIRECRDFDDRGGIARDCQCSSQHLKPLYFLPRGLRSQGDEGVPPIVP